MILKITLIIGVLLLIMALIIAFKPRTQVWSTAYVKEIQITNTGIVILKLTEPKGFESVLVLKESEIQGKIYNGNIKYRRGAGYYEFIPDTP